MFLRILIKIYSHLLRFYPASFREEFEEEMLLDFSDMTEAASEKGFLHAFLVFLREMRDFPISLLQIYLEENHMTAVFRAGPTRAALQGAFGLSLALITMWTTNHLIVTLMQDQGWTFLLRIANSLSWHLDYNASAGLALGFFALLLSALLGGIVLALCFWETRRIRRYLAASIFGWVAPLALTRMVGSLLKINDEVLRNSILDYIWIILAGLGFGAIFSLILRDRKKTPWLLLAGVLGYYAATNLALWLLLPLFPTYISGSFTWSDLTYIAGVYGVTGIVIGAMLGAISGWSRQSAAPV